ncbi:MAG: hypothetical protein L0H15_12495 [Nitrosospira sp.]|nr:hypothetical protein [Nitrosospira sp.]
MCRRIYWPNDPPPAIEPLDARTHHQGGAHHDLRQHVAADLELAITRIAEDASTRHRHPACRFTFLQR